MGTLPGLWRLRAHGHLLIRTYEQEDEDRRIGRRNLMSGVNRQSNQTPVELVRRYSEKVGSAVWALGGVSGGHGLRGR